MNPFIQTPPDGGMLYTETNLQHFFPEPLNTLTSCFFLAIALYWTVKLRGNFKTHRFLSMALVLLYIGGIGGTTYHGLRRWPVFIIMDWLPIMLLCLSAGVYFLTKVTRWYWAALMVLLYMIFQFVLRSQVHKSDLQFFINLNYAAMAALVLLPVLSYLYKTRWKNGIWVLYALVSFIFALVFRMADKSVWLATGTHFLWHTFGALASFCMFQFIYLLHAGNKPRPV